MIPVQRRKMCGSLQNMIISIEQNVVRTNKRKTMRGRKNKTAKEIKCSMTGLRNTAGDPTQLKKIAEGFLDSMRLILVAATLCLILVLLLVFKASFFANAENGTFWIIYGTITTAYLITRLPWAYIYDDTHDKFDKTKTQPSETFIIAATNEEGGIIEMIVINDGSTDGALCQIVRAVNYFGHLVRVVSFESNRGKREAMAAGVKAAKNDIIVFVDSDSFIRKDALRHI